MHATERPIAVTTFGGLRVSTQDDANASANLQGKLGALLTLLAVERTVTRERVVALLWDGIPEEKARHSLSQALVRLKQELSGDWLDAARESLRIDTTVWCDTSAFDAAIDSADFETALRLYRGPFLDGFHTRELAFEQWSGRRAAAFAVRLRDAARTLISTHVARTQLDHALACARRWADVAPEEDEAQHRLIELLASTGHRSEALEHFELYHAALKRDDLQPLDETVAIVERIRRGESLGALTTMLRGHEARADALRTRRFGSRTVSGPRLVRIAEGGVEAETYFLADGANRVGRTGCEIAFPFDTQMADVHASLNVEATQSGLPRITLRDESGKAVYLRIHDIWPLRHGDRFRAGQQQFRFEIVTDADAVT